MACHDFATRSYSGVIARSGRARVVAVVDTLEKQAGRRGGEPRRHVGGLGQKSRGRARIELAASDFHQHTDDAAHHLPEEVRSFDPDEHEIAGRDDVEAIDQDKRRRRPPAVRRRVVVAWANDWKSRMPTNTPAACSIRVTSRGSFTHHTYAFANAVRRRAI